MPRPLPGTHEENAARRVGSTLSDKWHLDRLLGIGGMAAVYAATHRNGTRAAIKIFRPSILEDDTLRERFLREGYLANRVEHPGAVKVFDDQVSDEGEPFLVMELVLGETLQQRFEQRGPIEPRALLAIVDKLLDVLTAAHARGIVHRDLKPDNIVETPQGEVRILDFGIAHRDSPLSPTRTVSGVAMGTPAYMPPEQALGRTSAVGPRSDIYAVGAMMFYLSTGEFAHDASSAQELMVKAAHESARSLTDAWPEAPPGLARVVDRACRFAVEDRYESAAAMRADLHRAAENEVDEADAPASLHLLTPRSGEPTKRAASLDPSHKTLPSQDTPAGSLPVIAIGPVSRTETSTLASHTQVAKPSPLGKSIAASWRAGAAVAGMISLIAALVFLASRAAPATRTELAEERPAPRAVETRRQDDAPSPTTSETTPMPTASAMSADSGPVFADARPAAPATSHPAKSTTPRASVAATTATPLAAPPPPAPTPTIRDVGY